MEISINLESKGLANLLISCASDWEVVLDFLENVCIYQGEALEGIDVDTVSSIIKKEYAEDEQ